MGYKYNAEKGDWRTPHGDKVPEGRGVLRAGEEEDGPEMIANQSVPLML